jgi:2-iminobutanoate/2-iminopropanoate deaminase
MPTKQPIVPGGADTATGPYTPGLAVGDLVFVSGQGPFDAAKKQFVLGEIEDETRLTLNNVKSVLEAAGCTMDDCVKVTVHLKRIADFDRFNVVYRQFFTKPFPCRTTVESVLGAGIAIEIDAIALRGCGERK